MLACQRGERPTATHQALSLAKPSTPACQVYLAQSNSGLVGRKGRPVVGILELFGEVRSS